MTAAVGLVIAGAALSGCMSSPTYGTDKTSGEQLLGDVSNVLSLGPKERKAIDYKPRPELVRPVKGAQAVLPAPQESVASVENNPAWPESPEQKRARLRADADANRDNPTWKPQIEPDLARAEAGPKERNPVMNTRHLETGVAPVGFSTSKQSEAFRKKLAEERQGSPTTRKYLSEPPLDYRQASASAPVGELGEDEIKKERRLKAEARKKGDRKWGDFLPW